MHPTGLHRTSDAAPLLVGESEVISQLRTDIEIASRSDAKVMIVGETGVGKEVVAQLIHRAGNRQRQPFVAINCAGLPDSLLESELFGHVRGSFTGAYRDKPGLAAQADRGTLFLDELGEMSARMQGVLLRFVETGEIHRLGAERMEKRVDTRIITATNRNLLERIASGDFREDLYYRLNVIHIVVPPLRERGTDIVRLFNHYLTHYCRTHGVDVPELAPSTEELLLSYRWPGNVRELKNIAERVTVRNHRLGPIRPDMLPAEIRREATGRGADAPSASANPSTQANPVNAVPHHPAADAAWNEMVIEGKSFWLAVHPLFIERELTKTDVREIIRRGLRQTQGSYRKLIELFHLPASDYKRFLAFLYQHDCHLAFHPFREQRLMPAAGEESARRVHSL
jgi:transcriptional regulator with PAS, ATPase and Fis domain